MSIEGGEVKGDDDLLGADGRCDIVEARVEGVLSERLELNKLDKPNLTPRFCGSYLLNSFPECSLRICTLLVDQFSMSRMVTPPCLVPSQRYSRNRNAARHDS